MKNRIFSLLKFLIGWPLALIALYFIIQIIAPQLPTLLTNFSHINLTLLFFGIFCFVIFYVLKSYIWHLLLKASGYALTFKQTCFLWSSSEIKRYIPGNIWGFLSRTVMFAQHGVAKTDIAKCLLFEAELLVLGAAIVSILSLPFLIHYGFLSIPISGLRIGYVLFGIVVLFYLFNTYGKKMLPKPVQQIQKVLFPPFAAEVLFSLLFFNVISFLFLGLGYYFVITSFVFLDPNLIWQLVGLSVFAFLLGYLSLLTPAGFGVREGALVIGLSKIITEALAGFVALFARIVMILAEVIFVLLALLWYRAHNVIARSETTKQSSTRLPRFARNDVNLEHWIKNHKHVTVLIFLFLIYVVYFTTISFLRYDNIYTGRFDLGNMTQTVWNTAQGRIFEFTNPDGTEIVSRLAFHADFFLIFFAPFYWIWDSSKILLLFQTVIVGAGSFFVYLIGKKILKNKNLALVFAFAYLINPSVERANLYDFHAVTLATTFLLATFYFFQQKRFKLFLLFAILAGLCKEQVWIIIGIFGLFFFFQEKKRLFGTLLFLCSFALSYFLISYAIPNMYGSEHFALSYYAEFGETPKDALITIITSPDKLISIFLEEDRVNFLKQIFSPLGYLSLFAPIYLLFIVPDLGLKLLSSNPNLYQIYYQYTAELSPFIFVSAIYGAAFLIKLTTKYNLLTTNILIVYLLITSLYTAYQYGPLPGAKRPNLDMITKPLENRMLIEQALATIPQDAKVAASNNVASHLSHREYIYVIPQGVDKADYVIFLLRNLHSPEKLPMEMQLIQDLKQNPQYSLVVEDDTFIMFKKWNP